MLITEKNSKLIAKEFNHLHIEQIFFRIRAYTNICRYFENNKTLSLNKFHEILKGGVQNE